MHCFRLKHIALASTLAVAALGTSPALAQLSANPTAAAIVADANANGRVLFVSGASAVFAGFGEIATSLLRPGFVQFAPGATTPSRRATDYVAFAGQLRNAAGGWAAGTNVIIINRALGGSVWGVNPVARPIGVGTAIESLAINAVSCTSGAGTRANPFLCNQLENRIPNAGISDVAPALFVGAINNEGETPAAELTRAELESLTALPVYTLGFGVPVTNNVPDTVRLNRATLAGIMSGTIQTWGDIRVGADPALPATLAAADMLVCRRVPGSGTQAIANLYFGHHPCTQTRNTPLTRDDGSAWNLATRTFTVEGDTGAVNVVELSTSGQLRSCLNLAVTASNLPFVSGAVPATLDLATGRVTPGTGYTHFTTADRDGRTTLVQFRNGRTHAAVGLLSLDSLNDSVAGSTGWSFRPLDGAGRMTWNAAPAAPTVTGTGRHATVANLINGTWDKVGVISFNIPSRTTGNMRALAEAVAAAARNPVILTGSDSLRHAAAAVYGSPDPTGTGQVQRVAFASDDQCGPLNLLPAPTAP